MQKEKILLEERKKKKQEERVEKENKKREEKAEEKKKAADELKKLISEKKANKAASVVDQNNQQTPTPTTAEVQHQPTQQQTQPQKSNFDQLFEQTNTEWRRTRVEISKMEAQKKTHEQNLNVLQEELNIISEILGDTNKPTPTNQQPTDEITSALTEHQHQATEAHMREKLKKMSREDQRQLQRRLESAILYTRSEIDNYAKSIHAKEKQRDQIKEQMQKLKSKVQEWRRWSTWRMKSEDVKEAKEEMKVKEAKEVNFGDNMNGVQGNNNKTDFSSSSSLLPLTRDWSKIMYFILKDRVKDSVNDCTLARRTMSVLTVVLLREGGRVTLR